MWRRLALGLVASLLAVAAYAVEGGNALPWVCFVRVIDTTRAGLESKVSDMLEQSILNAEVNVVPTEDLAAAARKRGVPRKRWAETGALSAVAKDVGADFLIFARLESSSRYQFQLEVYAVDVETGETVARQKVEVAGDIGRGKTSGGPSSSDVDALVAKLIASLPTSQQHVEPPPPPDAGPLGAPAPDAGPVAAAGGDAGPEDSWDKGFGPPSTSTGPEEAGASQILRELQAELGGRVSVDTFAYAADAFDPPPVVDGVAKVPSRQQVDLALRASVGGKSASGYASLLVRKDFADATRDRFEAEEAYADVDLFGVRLRGGRSYVTWGTVDLISPTDVLSPFDRRDLLDIEKLPAWSLRASYSFGPVSVEGYYLPLVEPDLLPLPTSIAGNGDLLATNRWVKGPSGVDVAASPVPLRFFLSLGHVPAPALENTQAAVRVRASAFGADFSVGYATLFDRLPALVTRAVVAQPLPLFADVTLEDRLLRRHLFVADGEYALGKLRFSGEWLLALEAGEKDVDKAALCAGADTCELTIEDPYTTVAAGVDWETPRFLEDQAVRVFFDVTGTQEIVTAGKKTEIRVPDFDDPIARLRHPLPLAVLTRIDYLLGDTARVGLLIVDNLARLDAKKHAVFTTDLLVVPAVQALFADVVTGRVEAAFLFGDPDGSFGRYPENLRVGASLGVSF